MEPDITEKNKGFESKGPQDPEAGKEPRTQTLSSGAGETEIQKMIET